MTLEYLIEKYIEKTGYGMDMWSKEENVIMTTVAEIIEESKVNKVSSNTLLPAVVPSQSEVDYSKVKQTCLCGVSVNLCDKVIMPDYGKRCPCVVAHYNGS